MNLSPQKTQKTSEKTTENTRIKGLRRIKLLCGGLALTFMLAACGGSAEQSSTSAEYSPPEQSEAPVEVVREEPFRDDIDFDELKGTNEDVIAWVEMPGTVIDYPVMRGVDNAKYLTTTVEGEYDPYGAVFADMQNPDDLLTGVSVLYGHFTPDETYFTQLHEYKDEQYFEENPDFFLYTPYRQERFEVVAAITIDNRNILYERNYNDPEDMQYFIDWISDSGDENAVLNVDDLEVSDRFMVLSTCVAEVGGETERFIVVGKMMEQR